MIEISNLLPQRMMEILNMHPKAPKWIKTYFEWHAIEREKLLYNNITEPTKALIIICHRDMHCGGIADRLKSLPYYVTLAEKTNRMLFIKWEKFNLEDFMQPPKDGFDWRLPENITISPDIDYDGSLIDLMNNETHELHEKQYIFLSTHMEHKHEIEFDYNIHEIEALHRVILNYFFEPVAALRQQIKVVMDSLGLVPQEYVAAHYRSNDHLFNEGENVSLIDDKIEYEIHNAIQCAVEKGDNKSYPVYFTSSHSKNVKYVLRDSPFAADRNPPVKVLGNVGKRIHSEYPGSPGKNYDYEEHAPTELYPIFIDLWLMAYSKCVAFGSLGFGRLGARLGGGWCYANHQLHSCPVFF